MVGEGKELAEKKREGRGEEGEGKGKQRKGKRRRAGDQKEPGRARRMGTTDLEKEDQGGLGRLQTKEWCIQG